MQLTQGDELDNFMKDYARLTFGTRLDGRPLVEDKGVTEKDGPPPPEAGPQRPQGPPQGRRREGGGGR
jgi:hypothetical protein